MEIRKRQRKEGGFTLIELITVIIILGILAAVVTPRYFSMVADANDAAAEGALAEGAARLNLAFAQHIMNNNGTPPANLAAINVAAGTLGANNVDLGDYEVSFSQTDNNITITLFDAGGVAMSNAAGTAYTKVVPWPGS